MRNVKLYRKENGALFGFDIETGECCHGSNGHVDFNGKIINSAKKAKKAAQGYRYIGDCKVADNGGVRTNPEKKYSFVEIGEPGEGFWQEADAGIN